jgi:hypothetical protein
MTEAAKASPQASTLEDDLRGLIGRTLEECRWVIGGVSDAATS